MMRRLARLRVPLGCACGGLALWLARPTMASVAAGMAIALAGEALRIWAAGHIDKGREVTRSGPYKLVRHPLYLGSAIIGVGFMIAVRKPWVAALVTAYLGTTYLAAMRSEEGHLDEKFDGAYAAYRDGRSAPVERSFSWARLRANEEYRAIAGLAIGLGLLYLKSRF